MNELSKIFIEYSNIFLNFFKNNLTIFFKCTKYTFCMFLSYLIYRQLPFKNKTKLLYLKNDFNNQIAKKLNPINYRPTFFMPDCSMQMIYHQFYPRPIIKFKREYIQTPDKGIFSMDWVIDEKVQKYNKLLVILHGLTGGSEAGYLREIIKEFLDYGGYKIVVIHNRGISDTPLFTPFPFHASFTSDLKFALKIIKQRFPNIFCAALGVSMGANIFVKFLANDYSLNNYIRCFVSISNPLNLEEGEKRNRGTLIDTHLKQAVIAYFSRHRILKANKNLDYEQMNHFENYRDVDVHYTIKIHKKFKTVEDYYQKSSSCYDLDKLKTYSLFINSRDDILSPVYCIDFSHCKKYFK